MLKSLTNYRNDKWCSPVKVWRLQWKQTTSEECIPMENVVWVLQSLTVKESYSLPCQSLRTNTQICLLIETVYWVLLSLDVYREAKCNSFRVCRIQIHLTTSEVCTTLLMSVWVLQPLSVHREARRSTVRVCRLPT